MIPAYLKSRIEIHFQMDLDPSWNGSDRFQNGFMDIKDGYPKRLPQGTNNFDREAAPNQGYVGGNYRNPECVITMHRSDFAHMCLWAGVRFYSYIGFPKPEYGYLQIGKRVSKGLQGDLSRPFGDPPLPRAFRKRGGIPRRPFGDPPLPRVFRKRERVPVGLFGDPPLPSAFSLGKW